jgi:MYXO-CTERM domain-containing protein
MIRCSLVMARTHSLRGVTGSALVIAISATPSLARAFDVQPTSYAPSLAESLLTNPQLNLVSASYSGADGAAAVFGSGPMGSNAGMVLTTGMANAVLPPNDLAATSTDHGLSGAGICDSLVPGPAFDPVVLHVELTFPNTFDSLRIPVVFASEEYPESSSRNPSDAGAIYVNGQLAGQFNAASLAQDGVYGAATESELDAAAAFVIDVPSLSGAVNTIDIVLCDGGDAGYDSALFVSAIQPCYDGICGTIGPCGIVDLDFDGESACTDCDDLDPDVNAFGVETCNGKDDNCNGLVDGPFGVGVGCAVGVGACYRTGHMACIDAASVACDAAPGLPEAEQCGDSIDSDCDGFIDPLSGCGSSSSGGSGGGASSSGGASSGGEGAGGESASGGQSASGGAAASGGSANGGSASGGAPSGGEAAQAGSDQGAGGEDGGLNGTSVPDDTVFAGDGCSCDTTGSGATRTSIGAVAVLALAAFKRRRRKA